MKATYELIYRRNAEGPEISSDDARVFAEVNGLHNAWPYFRELVSTTFGRFGYLPFTIDSLVLTPDEHSAPPEE